MRPSGNVLPAYWCVWLHVVWLCCGKESNGKISKASFLVLEMEMSKYSSVNPNIFFYHLQTILFMGTKPARRCEKRHKNRENFMQMILRTLILGRKEMESYFCLQSSCFYRWLKNILNWGKVRNLLASTVSASRLSVKTQQDAWPGQSSNIKKVNWMLPSGFSINVWSCSLIISKCPYKYG